MNASWLTHRYERDASANLRAAKTLVVLGGLALSLATAAAVQMPLPSHNGNFTGLTRGFWFVAPNNFVITGMQVPTVAGNGAQSMAVLRLAAPPGEFPQTTNAFETLFLIQGDTTDGMVPTRIAVNGGDIIGVLGARGASVNSYGNSNFDTSINGGSATLVRMGFQGHLQTTAPANIWQEAAGASLSRVEILYEGGNLISETASPPEAGTVVCTPEIVPNNGISSCSVSANPGWVLQSVSGCAGTPSTATSYTTGAVSAHCAVTATFSFIGFELFTNGFEGGSQIPESASAQQGD